MHDATTPLQGSKNRLLKFIGTVMALWLLVLLPISSACAETHRILIVSSGSSSVYTNIIDTIESIINSNVALSKTNTAIKFDVLFLKNTSTAEQLQRKLKDHDLLLTIGQKAMVAATKINSAPPTIAALIPKQSYDKYRAALHSVNNKTTAVFIDNPPERQILLAQVLLGKKQRLGALLGEQNSQHEIKLTIKEMGIDAHIETVKRTDNLIRRLSDILNEIDVFLAFPDAQIFNRNTAKNILLTTYRQRIPIIAYSASYVKAGALAAVYSTPQQIAKQTADTLINILRPGATFPLQGAYPRKFEISINNSVAKSLGIPVFSEAETKAKLVGILRKNK